MVVVVEKRYQMSWINNKIIKEGKSYFRRCRICGLHPPGAPAVSLGALANMFWYVEYAVVLNAFYGEVNEPAKNERPDERLAFR